MPWLVSNSCAVPKARVSPTILCDIPREVNRLSRIISDIYRSVFSVLRKIATISIAIT